MTKLLSLLVFATLGVGCFPAQPVENDGHARLVHQQDLIKKENSLKERIQAASGEERALLEEELVEVSAELDELEMEDKARQERVAARKAAALAKDEVQADTVPTKPEVALEPAPELEPKKKVRKKRKAKKRKAKKKAAKPARYCAKTCRNSQACGNSCISNSYTCHKPPGNACQG